MTFRLDWTKCALDPDPVFQDNWVYLTDHDYVEEIRAMLYILGCSPDTMTFDDDSRTPDVKPPEWAVRAHEEFVLLYTKSSEVGNEIIEHHVPWALCVPTFYALLMGETNDLPA